VGGARLEVLPTIERLAEILLGRPIDDDAERAGVVVLEHEDHRAIEVRVVERRRRDEQPSLRRSRPWQHDHSLPNRATGGAP
jgi:hypothetical protein